MTASTTTTRQAQALDPLDGASIRQDFPIFHQPLAAGREPLVFLDSAASSQKPQQVIDAVSHFYETSNANIHRGVYELSEIATGMYEESRQKVATFINALSAKQCIFVRNITEGINLVAQSWGRENLKCGDRILLTILDHHSNIVPWQILAGQIGLEIDFAPLTSDQRIDMDAFSSLLQKRPRLVAFPHVSNAMGTVNDVAEMTRLAHDIGAFVVIDAAQSVPHMPVDVQAIDCDFLAFTGHKMLGPLGSGVLYGRRELLEAMPPFMGGGSMIRKVTTSGTTFADIPARFEAGTPAVADVVGLGVAIDYLTELGPERIIAHERELLANTLEELPQIPGVTVYGPDDLMQRSGALSFTVDGIHPHDVAAILDSENVAVRAGHHCAQPLMDYLGVGSTTRASFYVYNTHEDVDRLVAGLHKANKIFGTA